MSDAIATLIRALAKKAARDHMRENPNAVAHLRRARSKRVGLPKLPPAA